MTSADPSDPPLIITLINPNVNSQEKHLLYLLTARDDTKNELLLSVQNISGAAVTFTQDTPLQLSMGTFPADVVDKIEVGGEAGWSVKPYELANHKMRGLYLTPTAPKRLEDGAALAFTLTNIVFTADEVAKGSKPYNFKVGYKVPSEGGYPIDILVKPWAAAPDQLFNFEAAFIAVPESEGWNVKVGNTPEYLADKANAAVFSNCAPDRPIQTRLALRLTNQDRMYPLVLTEDSILEVRFLAGEDHGALANDQNLAKIDISPLGAGAWSIEKLTDGDTPAWTIKPKTTITLAERGGSCEFLIDKVLPNGVPRDNRGAPDITQMYIFHTKVPHRHGSGHYEDGYLTASIEKVALEPRVPRIWISPPDNGRPHEINSSITMNWCALGVESVTISYIDQDGKPQSKKQGWTGTMTVTPPAYPTVRRTTTYQCTSEGGPAGYPVTVQSLFDRRFTKRQLALVYGSRQSAADRAEPPRERDSTIPIFMHDLKGAVVTVGDDGRAELQLTCRDQSVHASGSWWTMVSDGGDFSLTLSLTLDAKCRRLPYGPSNFVELPPTTAFTLLGKCTGHELTLGDIVAGHDCYWVARAISGKDNSTVGDYYEVFCRSGDKWKLS